MKEQDGKIYVGFGIDNSELDKDSKQSEEIIDKVGKAAERTGARIDTAFQTGAIAELASQLEEASGRVSEQSKYVEGLKNDYAALAKQAGAALMSGQDEAYRKLDAEMQKLNQTINEEERSLGNLKTELGTVSAEHDKATTALAKMNEEAGKSESTFVKLLGGQEKYNTIISAMPGPLKAATTSIMGMVKAALAFIATPLGATIAAIALGLKALKTWFDSSAEGQRAFVKVTSYLSGILGQLKEVVINTGKAIYEAFTNPKQAVAGLWEAIKTNIVNRIEGLGGMFKALGEVISKSFQGDFSGAGNALKEMGSQAVKAATGVDDLVGKIQKSTMSVLDAAKATQSLKIAEQKLDEDRSKFNVQASKLQLQANEALQRYYKSGSKDKKALKEYEEATNQIYDQRLKFAEEEVRIKKGLADLTSNTIEDNKEIEASEARLVDVQNERLAALRRTDRMQGSQARTAASGEESAERKAEKEYIRFKFEQLQKLNKAETDLERSKISDREELRKYDLKKALEAIEEEKQAFIELAKAKGEKAPDVTVFEKRKVIEAGASEQDKILAEQETNKKLLNEYATYSEQYLAKTKELAEKRQGIMSAGGSEANIAMLTKQIEDEQKKLDEAFFKNTADFETFSAKIVTMNVSALSDMVDEMLRTLRLSGEGMESESNMALRAQIEMLRAQIKTINQKDKTTGKGEDLKKWQATNKVLNDIVKTTTQVIDGFEGIDDQIKNVLKTMTIVASSTISIIDGIKTFAKASTEGIATGAKAAAAAVQAVEKASVILAVISAAIQVATAIFNMFTSANKKRKEELAKIAKEQEEFEKKYNELLAKRALLFEKSSTIFGVDAYSKGINAARVGLDKLAEVQEHLTTGWRTFVFFGTDFTKQVKAARTEVEKQFEGLADIQVKTGWQKTGLFGWGKGKAVFSGILEAIPNIIDENGKFSLSIAKLALETRTFDDASKKALEDIVAAAEQAEAAFEQVRDYLTGIFGQLGSNMTDGIIQSFKAGKNAASTFVDDIGAMLEKLGQDMLYSIMLQPLFEAASKQMEAIMQDTRISPEDQFKQFSKVMGQLAIDATGKQAEMSALLEQFRKDAAEQGLDIYKKETGKQGQAKGKEAMALTEDTGASIDGKLTALQLTSAQTADNTFRIADTTLRIEPLVTDIRDGMDVLTLNSRKIYEEVVTIRKFTEALPRIESGINKVVTNTEKMI